ncbi:MAG: YwaF family protein [Olsenella sp.]|nr:YwaF family protein [Olsenella sp.]MCI1288900.1 YwaF family protein [Olsenella sp.]
MKYSVFTAQPLLLKSGGFALFGLAHLAWLVACACVVRLVTWAHGRWGLRALRVASVAAVCLLVSDDALMVASHTFTPAWWPLHFCNAAEYLCVAYAVHPSHVVRELLLTLGICGGLCAVLFPGWLACPPYTWPVVCGFMEHSLILSTSICAVREGRASIRMRDVLVSYAFVAAYVVFFRWFNAAMGTNFGFVSGPAYGTPIEDWYNALGDPLYLVPYAALFVVGALLLHVLACYGPGCGRQRGRGACA